MFAMDSQVMSTWSGPAASAGAVPSSSGAKNLTKVIFTTKARRSRRDTKKKNKDAVEVWLYNGHVHGQKGGSKVDVSADALFHLPWPLLSFVSLRDLRVFVVRRRL